MKKYGFGVDVGGTTCKIGLFDMSGVILENDLEYGSDGELYCALLGCGEFRELCDRVWTSFGGDRYRGSGRNNCGGKVGQVMRR